MKLPISASALFHNCTSTDEQLNLLGECYLDAHEWRYEEAKELARMRRDLEALSRRIDALDLDAMGQILRDFQRDLERV